MRNAFADEIRKLADKDDRIILLSGDIGNRLFNPFKDSHPNRFVNCGVAEANMTGVAAGLALSGYKPITYTITAFNTVRCLEQIRIDIAYQNLPVVIVGVGSGLSYAALNATHHALEDVAMLRSLPNMSVICPADAWEVRAALRASLNHNGPVYIRLGKKNEPLIHGDVPNLIFGKSIPVRDGTDVCFLGCGTALSIALEAAEKLSESDISTKVYSFHTVKPLDNEALENAFSNFKVVATVEEHSMVGGLGSAVAEWLADRGGENSRLLRFGTEDRFLYKAGGQDHARRELGLSVDVIVRKTRDILNK